ncbi:MAG: polyprenyl diphosphate synthase [Thermoguttaceae bacterium]
MHVAIIMDGNGRWAKMHGLPRHEGHRAGAGRVREICEECQRRGFKQLTLYCLSSENWKRPPVEIDFLMSLLSSYLVSDRSTLMENNIRLSIIGRRAGIPNDVLEEMDRSIALTSQNTGMQLCLAINYGARAEIVDAVKKIVASQIPVEAINEETISSHLYTAGMSDPDLLIRTAGEMRLSNYLLWQISYAEFWCTSKCWPDFDLATFDEALSDFAKRTRRFGGLDADVSV